MLDALVLQRAVDVVGAEVQRHRGRLLAQRHPVRLDVREVVEEQPPGGDRLQRIRGRCLARHELRGRRLVGEGNEGDEPAGGVLLLAQPQQVVDALGQRLDVAVQHRGVRLDAERVRDAVDLAPPLGIGLARVLEQLREPRREDLGAAAGHGAKPGRLQPRQRVLRLDLPAPPEVIDLGRGERLDLHLGMRGVDGLDHPLVVLERPVGMVAAHDVHLAGLVTHHRHHVLDRVLVGAGLAGLAREAAEGAREDADVGRRDVAVDDEVHAITLAPGLDVIGHAPDAEEVVRLEEGEAVLAAQALARADLVPDGLEPAVTESHGMSPRPARARRSGWSV